MTASERAIEHVAGQVKSGSPVHPELRITLNFHPDRLHDGRLMLAKLVADGVYLSQFATATSNGGLTAHPGGDRWRWESRIFGGVYDDSPPRERPVYGALNFRRRSVGAAPRFGSAHFRLTAEAVHRSTFCYPDSWLEPTAFGVADRMPLIALAEADRQAALTADDPHEYDELNDYIEAQTHGPVRLDTDVEALVLDPCYRGTEVEAVAAELPCLIEWHPGFRLHVDELVKHPDYRGQQYVDLGLRIAEHGWLDPYVIGKAVREHDPQDVKKVWHYLARFS
ncbi:DUF3626 domain-containing protein [Kribbella deserti]|uniref:DUF3626 domain-containing protein n=1 Tax=Kribbella deserti TaxID=1926257 RepID=A0ABV6QP20_9ACTN